MQSSATEKSQYICRDSQEGDIASLNHICFCADGKYIDYIPAALESALKSAQFPERYHVTVLVDQQPSDDICSKLELLCPGRAQIRIIDSDQFSDLLEVTHISRGMYYRLLIPEIITADRVLYLDCDVIVRKDLQLLFDQDMGDNSIAAVVNPFYDATRLGIKRGIPYFNSGVMVINSVAWREHDVKSKVLEFLREKSALLKMPDQDALNAVLKDTWLELPPTYNCQVSMILRHRELADELGSRWTTQFLGDPAIMHFSSAHKQWHYTCRIKLAMEYRGLSMHKMEYRRGMFGDFITSVARSIKYSVVQSNPYFH